MPRAPLTLARIRRLVAAVAALALLGLGPTLGTLAQDATPTAPEASPVASGGGPALGDAVVLFDDDGDELAQVAVLAVEDPYEGVDVGGRRGFRYVAVEVVVENLSDAPYRVDTTSIRVVDGEGGLYAPGFVSRPQEARDAVPDLSSAELEPGAATSGLLVYELVDGAAPALVVSSSGTSSFTVLADLGGDAAAPGAATTLYDARGDEVGTVGLDEVLPGLEETSDAFDVDRGQTVLGAVVTVENTGDDPLTVEPRSMYVVDEFGYLYGPSAFSRPEEEAGGLPEDLAPGEVAAGESATGLVTFQLPGVVVPSYVLYLPGGEQLFVVAQLGEGPVVSGDVLTPVPVPTEEPVDGGDDGGDDTGQVAAGCEGVSEWGEATAANLAVFDRLETTFEDLSAVTAEDLRDAADDVRDAADAQTELEVPEVAADTQDAVVAYVEAFAGALDDAAAEIEAGADPQDVLTEDLLGPGTELGAAYADLEAAGDELAESCPEVDDVDL